MTAKELFHPNYLKKCTKKADIVQCLTRLHKFLSDLDQDAKRPEGFENTALQLAAPRLLNNDDKEVRLLAVCCIVDVLRLFAPNAPYSPVQLVSIFEVLVSQLRGMSTYAPTTGNGVKIGYIIVSLARVKSCVCLVELAQNGQPEQLDALFDVLINSVRPHHDDEILLHVESILESCLEECEPSLINQDIMETLLLPLLPSARTDNAVAYTLTQAVLRRSCQKLQAAMNSYLINMMASSLSTKELGSGGAATNMEVLAEQLYPLIYELHKVSAGLLVDVIPSICSQLHAEEEELRLKAVSVLGTLFGSEYANYGVDLARSFKDFLQRFVDVSPKVRLAMVETAAGLLGSKPGLHTDLEDCLMRRLKDGDADVRLAALNALGAVLVEDPLRLQVGSAMQLLERVKDRVYDVRKTALETVSKAYFRHLSSVCIKPIFHSTGGTANAALSMNQIISQIPSGIWERFEFVPGFLVNCWGFPEIDFKLALLRALQEHIIPRSLRATATADGDEKGQEEEKSSKGKKKGGEGSGSAAAAKRAEELQLVRANALLVLCHLLTPKEKSLLGSILSFKSKVRAELSNFLYQRSLALGPTAAGTATLGSGKAGSKGKSGVAAAPSASSANAALMRRARSNLLQALPVTNAAQSGGTGRNASAAASSADFNKKCLQMLDKLQETKDKHVFRLLSGCTEYTDGATEMLVNREDLQQRLDSKSMLGEYSGALFTACAPLICNGPAVDYLMSNVMRAKTSDDVVLISEVLELLSKGSAYLFTRSVGHVQSWVESIWTGSKPSFGAAIPVALRACCHISTMICNAGVLTTENRNLDAGTSLATALFSSVGRCTTVAASTLVADAVFKLSTVGCHSDALRNQIQKFLVAAIPSVPVLSQSSPRPVASKSKSKAKGKASSAGTESATDPIFDGSSARLGLDVNILAILIQIPGLLGMKSNETLLNEFIRSTVLRLESSSAGTMPLNSNNIGVVCATLKLWSRVLLQAEVARESEGPSGSGGAGLTTKGGKARKSTGRTSTSSTDSGRTILNDEKRVQTVSDELREFFDIVFNCMLTGGEYLVPFVQVRPADMESMMQDLECDNSHSGSLRLACAGCVMELLRVRTINKAVTVAQWQLLGWSLIDENLDNRKKLLVLFGELIQRSPVHPRFLAYPCLLANDESLFPLAQQYLVVAIKRLRCTHEELCTRAMTTADPDEIDRLHVLAQAHMPESILPYVLYLLSHHPDFPQSATMEDSADQIRLKAVIQSVRMVVSALLDTLPAGCNTGNLSLIFKQVNMIAQYYKDRLDEDNLGLHFVTQVTTKILKERIRTVENVQAYPGDVHLPMDLYKAYDNSAMSMEQKAIKTAVLVEAESSVDRVLGGATGHAPGAGGNKRKPAPKKASSALLTKNATVSDARAKKRSANIASPGSSSGDDRAAKKSKGKGTAVAVAVAPPRASSRPQRSTALSAVSYKEQDENNAEAARWESIAEKNSSQRQQRKSLSTL